MLDFTLYLGMGWPPWVICMNDGLRFEGTKGERQGTRKLVQNDGGAEIDNAAIRRGIHGRPSRGGFSRRRRRIRHVLLLSVLTRASAAGADRPGASSLGRRPRGGVSPSPRNAMTAAKSASVMRNRGSRAHMQGGFGCHGGLDTTTPNPSTIGGFLVAATNHEGAHPPRTITVATLKMQVPNGAPHLLSLSLSLSLSAVHVRPTGPGKTEH